MVTTRENAIGSLTELPDAATWDDGCHGKVSEISVWYTQRGVCAVKFSYLGVTGIVKGEIHGPILKIARNSKIKLDSDEYVKKCIAHFGDLNVGKIEFHTNKKKFECGVEPSGESFSATFGAFNNNKIVGFHGVSSSLFLHKIGVYRSQ
ncbi:hypothetical protein AALP_AA5G250400 [Arabis alpina]|uniref:Jacalin-type lectin domain-containing protein n=1 Tax=Arabis alpina TaxID=50452 RepID=A0A087GZ79_ARAAL|nr:hypothetical protein AALP_AA5G250400 [Arabis alpina]